MDVLIFFELGLVGLKVVLNLGGRANVIQLSPDVLHALAEVGDHDAVVLFDQSQVLVGEHGFEVLLADLLGDLAAEVEEQFAVLEAP